MNQGWLAELDRRVSDLIAHDEQVRDAQPLLSVGDAVQAPELSTAQVVATIMAAYADRPALGQRAVEFVTEETGRRRRSLLPRFDTVTYRELWDRVGALAAAWRHDAESPVGAGDFVAILGFASIDYVTVDLACTYLGTVSVPLQAGASLAQLTPIVAETEPRVFATNVEQLDAATELALAADSVRTLIVFDYLDQDDDHRTALDTARRRLADTPVRVETLGATLARGRDLPPVPPHADEQGDPLALLIYTSGSTGTPKGAMYPASMVARFWRATDGRRDDTGFSVDGRVPLPTIGLAYMPMSHVAGRVSLINALARGGTVYFAARSDMSTLFDDIALVRPTVQFFVPRVCDMVFQRFQSEVDHRLTAEVDRAAVEEQVKTEVRDRFLGGRIIAALSGSAPLSAEMRAFMESVLDLHLIDGYGATETGGGILVDTVIQRPPVLDYKLVDVPELGYFATDQPYPRGELLVKAQTLIPGYYKRPELNEQIFDADGFYRTGDVMAQIGPDQLVYVDRRNNVLKLSQGEFVAVSKLEALYTASPLVRQIYVYGSSERAYLLAVIVPTIDAAAAHPDVAELRAAIAESLQRVAREAELNSWEIPREFLLETEPFSIDNGLLSGIGKLLRPKLKARYGEQLEQLYAQLASEQADELSALRREARDLPVPQVVGRAARAVLGLAEGEVSLTAQFAELGGDSLSALSFSNLLGELFDVEVPVGVIVSAATDLRGIADYIEAERDSGGKRPTATSVHGGGTTIRAADLTLDKFIDAATLAAAPALPPASQQPRTVLLTGANGYLGRFLCLEWLQRLHDSGGRLVCIVRGSDAAAARKRLDDAFDSGDAQLLRRYRELAEGRLEVLAGDIGDSDLGVSEGDWRRLAETVDLIVHPAALVNHVLPYNQLFGPNVVGTAEIIRLALTHHIKPVTYLSTVAVADQIAPEAFTEDGDIREISAVRSLGESYANGYGNSKWAGEVLLREAHELCGLPVAVFRSDMILAHSRFAGQVNVADMFTRLVLSLLATGIAPKSFYRLDADGNRQRAHYDGLPADFTAESITVLGAQVTSGYETFDVLNPHDDGFGLDEFVDWLIEAGEPIERIDDYRQWLSRFETALRALPERQRQHSLLPLLHAYQQPAPPVQGSLLPAKKFQAAVQAAKVGADHDIPHLNRALVEKYAADLRLRKLL
ncbi:thioester reductase domain-containing protein [Nocardia sp. CDC159]|uniref:Carboxylic acid reductase n=1 Tax=Nocardia pulmonis TaxID=2951408 RepID=A0A9X2E3I2_9NOCA|nr:MULTISPECIES: carboxylic acid reductase [Nocardia]MCM6773592.1 thioester reductase domain-containing protein [Nocardia pulmonis]MCM6786479.1 thioester reductase domain-containing protein [Nocardia sp. CDC159]